MATQSGVTIRPDGCILLTNVRLSYPHLFQKWGMNEGDKKKYSAKFLLPKSRKEDIAKLAKHLKDMALEAFKSQIPADKYCLRDGDLEGKETSAGNYVLAASEDKAPDVINRDRSRINEDDDIVYAGCWVNVLFRPWVQKNQFGKRINANLLAVQFVRDDEAFSGIERPDVDDAFGDISGDFEGADEGTADDDSDPFA